MPESAVKNKILRPSDCFVQQYPLAVIANAEIKSQLEKWLKDGTIKRTKPNPTFHSSLLAVPKRDPLTGKTNKLRICCDLRTNTAILDKDCYENFAVPKIDEIFSKVAGNANITSVFDLKQAYLAIPVSPESRHCLIFNHKNLTYQWTRASFRLKFLASQFVYTISVLFDGIEQELKDEVKKLYIKQNKSIGQIDNEFQAGICCYLDDVVVYAENSEFNALMVRRLSRVSLRTNTDKCSFFQTSDYLLGLIISKNITKIDTKRLSNIDSWEISKTTKKKLHKSILLRRAIGSKVIKRKKIHSKDHSLNDLAIKLNSKEFKQTITDYVCPPEQDCKKIIQDTRKAGHFGITAVIKYIHTYNGLHWNSIYKDVKEILLSCKECQMHNVEKKGFDPARSVVSYKPFDFISIDMIGPLLVTERGNCYILVVVDICTKYIIARPAPNKQNVTMATILVSIYGD